MRRQSNKETGLKRMKDEEKRVKDDWEEKEGKRVNRKGVME